MAKKPTLQEALEARRSDPRAIRGAVQFVGGKPRITLGVVGEHKRISIEVDGDKLKLVDDPNAAAPEKDADAPEKAATGGKGGKPGTDTTGKGDAGAGAGDNVTGD
jgi:hypothetical protein